MDKQSVSDAWKRDPRKAILSYLGYKDANHFSTPAYRAMQPFNLLAEKTEDEDEEERRIHSRFQDRNKYSHKENVYPALKAASIVLYLIEADLRTSRRSFTRSTHGL